jgi:hypothetical protein
LQVRISSEPLPAFFGRIRDPIDGPELGTLLFQKPRPPAMTGSDFEDRFRRQTISNPRENGAEPLRFRIPPRRGPLFARVLPVIFHGRTTVVIQ